MIFANLIRHPGHMGEIIFFLWPPEKEEVLRWSIREAMNRIAFDARDYCSSGIDGSSGLRKTNNRK